MAKAIEKAVPCKRINATVIGLEVPYAHLNLSPINGINDLNFEKPKLKLSNEEFKQILSDIKKYL